jgi:hypothetical protein
MAQRMARNAIEGLQYLGALQEAMDRKIRLVVF